MLLAAATLGLVAVQAPGASAAEVADASCPGPPVGAIGDPSPTEREAQTFTALNSGTLTRAQVGIQKGGGSTPADWVIQVLAVGSSGVPTNVILASATVPTSSVANGLQVITANFAPAPAVVMGQQYAIAVGRPGSNEITVQYRTGNPCAGSLFVSSTPASPFTMSNPTNDMVFSTFVTPPATGQRAAALKKCKKKFKKHHNKKKRKKCKKRANRLPV